MEITNTSKLTIILQYRNRYDFACRWLEFAYNNNCLFDIYVADGSINQLLKKYIKKNKIHLKLNIKYVKTEFDSSFNIYCKKLLKALKSIETPYVILADDDDFYNFNNIQKCVDRLETDKSLVTCGGQTAHFKILDGNIAGKKIHFDKCDKFYFKNASKLENIKRYLTFHEGIYYNVHRTEDFKNAWIINTKYKLSPRMSELFIELYIFTCGKIEVLPFITYFRQYNHPHVNSSAMSNDFIDEMLKFDWHKEINSIFNIISKKIAKSEKIKPEAVKEDLFFNYKVFLRPWIINNIDLEGKSSDVIQSRKLMIKNGLKYGNLKYFYQFLSKLKSYLNHFLFLRKTAFKESQIISDFLRNYKN